MRIRLSQVGDALAHHQECIFHHASTDRLVAGVASMVAVVVAKDEEVADFVIMGWDITNVGWWPKV